MSDFSELCPLFETGVYNELYLGSFTLASWDSATYNLLSNPGDPATCPSSFRLGRTVLVTEAFARRWGQATLLTATVCLLFGRRALSGTVDASVFGTVTYSMSTSAIPNIHGHWQAVGLTSFTLATADCLNIAVTEPDADASMAVEIIIQYRDK
jgi:hypothetical protein